MRDDSTREPAIAETLEVYRRAIDLGVIFGTTKYAGMGNVLKIKPPFTITRTQMDRVLAVLDEVLSFIESDVWYYQVHAAASVGDHVIPDSMLVKQPAT